MNIDIAPQARVRDVIAAGALLVLVFAALGAGVWIGSAQRPAPENTAPAPAQRQADGSLVLERRADSTPPAAPHDIPRGTTEVRRSTVKVKPKQPDCEPVLITTSIIQEGDGLRAVTSAQGAEVIEGRDMPIRALNLAPPARHWSAGVAYEPLQERIAVWADREIGRLRVGVQLQQRDDGGGFDPWIRIGVTF